MEFFDFNKLFNWPRLVEPIPGSGWQFFWWAVGLSAGLIVLAVIRAFLPGEKVLKHKVEAWSLTIGLLGLLLTFFRWQEIPYFSARIVWLVLAIWAFVWLVLIIYYRQVKIPQNILKLKVEARRKKYL